MDFPYSLSPLLSQRETAQGFNSPALKKKKKEQTHMARPLASLQLLQLEVIMVSISP